MEKLDKLAQIKRKDHFIQLVYKILFVAHDTNDFEILIYWLNTMARIYVLFEDYSHAIYLYEQIVRLSYIKKSENFRFHAYKQMGRCLLKLKQYQLTLKCFVKYLQWSWSIKKHDKEVHCYDLIGMVYFYLGELKKARYYHTRAMKGICEGDTDQTRYSIQRFKASEKERTLQAPTMITWHQLTENHSNDISFSSLVPLLSEIRIAFTLPYNDINHVDALASTKSISG